MAGSATTWWTVWSLGWQRRVATTLTSRLSHSSKPPEVIALSLLFLVTFVSSRLILLSVLTYLVFARVLENVSVCSQPERLNHWTYFDEIHTQYIFWVYISVRTYLEKSLKVNPMFWQKKPKSVLVFTKNSWLLQLVLIKFWSKIGLRVLYMFVNNPFPEMCVLHVFI